MHFFKNISIIFLAAGVLLSSNGFIMERYLCLNCNSEHREAALFEFGELKHRHNPCSECANNGHLCDCCNNEAEHQENSEVEYVTLDMLFVKKNNTSAKYLIPQVNIRYFGFDILFNTQPDINKNILITLFRLLKIPPLIYQFVNSGNFCSMLSIYRL